eukprot:405052_1
MSDDDSHSDSEHAEQQDLIAGRANIQEAKENGTVTVGGQPTNADDESHGLPQHIEDTKPAKIHIYVAKYPFSCWMFMCFWFLLCGAIIAMVPGMLRFSVQVPFYIRDDPARINQDALVAGRKDATWTMPDQTRATTMQQQDAAGEKLMLLYQVKDGHTLMTKEHLDIMDEIEDKVKATTGYGAYCLRIYDEEDDNGTCARQTSLTNFFDPRYFLPSIDHDYSLEPSFKPNFLDYFLPSLLIDPTKPLKNKTYDQEFVDQIVSYWAAYDKGEGPPEPYAQKYYHHETMPPKFFYKMQPQSPAYSVGNMFASLADKDFAYDTPFDTEVTTAMSVFMFGLPLATYENAVDDVEEQHDEMGQWCYDHLHSVFVDLKEEHKDKLDFYWDCATMGEKYSASVMTGDMVFMIATFLCIYLLMILSTGSVWLSSMGMGMIFLNFLPTLLLYRFIGQQEYFGMFQIMALFIILSIGADNIFVLTDTFVQYRTAAPNQPMDKRLTAVLTHAGKVMMTTSLSTCFSFLANCTSLFPAMYTFGIFAAFLIFVNYCAVVLFYPTVLAVHERYFYVPNLKRSCCMTPQCTRGGRCNRCCCMDNVVEIEADYDLTATDEDAHAQEKKRGIDAFFEGKFYPFVRSQRRRILIFTLVIFLVFAAFAMTIEADPKPPQMYQDGDNYQEFKTVLSDNFASETGRQLSVEIVWGIEGIDRTDTDETLNDDIGEVIYASNLSIASAEEQQYIAQICDDLLCLYSDYDCRYAPNTYYDLQIADPQNYGGRTRVVKCFMTAFRDWVLSNDSVAHPNDSDITELLEEFGGPDTWDVEDFDDCEYGVFPVASKRCFALLFGLIWINEEIPTSNPDYAPGKTNYDYWKDGMFGKDADEEDVLDGVKAPAKLKFFVVTVLTEASFTTPPVEGMQLFHDWETYGDNWRDNVDGKNTFDATGENEFVATPPTLQSIMITDKMLLAYYFVQDQIVYEAIFGIGLSLTLAFIILSLATGNWLVAMYSCFVIFVIVVCVIGFTVMNGWKLGVVEAVLFVMVPGMAVDYVVHLSEAYLSSGKAVREGRARRMLGMVGGSISSGAISTLLGIVWLFGAKNYVFYKFGALIFFLIATSCLTSLFSFSAAMSIFGPEGYSGNLMASAKRCYACLKGENADSDDYETTVIFERNSDDIQTA